MATATFDSALVGSETQDTAKAKSAAKQPKRSFWDIFVQAREKEARRRVTHHLSIYSDAEIASWGLSAREIEILRRGGYSSIDLAG